MSFESIKSSISRESSDTSENDESRISKERMTMLDRAIERMKSELTPDELKGIQAIICFGSTVRGTARKDSDLDLFVDWKGDIPFNPGIINKFLGILRKELPDVEIQLGLKPITPNNRSASFITRRSIQHPEQKSSWQIMYSKNEEVKQQLTNTLQAAEVQDDKRLKDFGQIE